MTLTLAKEQQRVVDANDPHLCVIACAGSGKTTTLTRRIARMIDKDDIDPSRIAAITFTVLAGENLRYELASTIKKRGAHSRVFVGTIHSFCFKMLTDHNALSGEAFEPITESQQFILLSKNWASWEIQKIVPESNKSSLIERLITTFDIVKMNSVPLPLFGSTHPEIARVYDLYSQYLHNNGFLDYADMLVMMADRLSSDNGFRSKVFSQYKFLFVDEYQDVDPVQAAVIQMLCQSISVCVVGDDDQAIYQFRGADERNLQEFATAPKVKTLPLSENRRSPENILSLAENSVGRVDISDYQLLRIATQAAIALMIAMAAVNYTTLTNYWIYKLFYTRRPAFGSYMASWEPGFWQF